MENPKRGIKLGGIGLFILVGSIGLGACVQHWIFAVFAVIGVALMIYALITGETKFFG